MEDLNKTYDFNIDENEYYRDIDKAIIYKKPTPIKIKLPATKEQTKHLDMLMEYFETEHIVCKQPIDRLIRYRQICQDPRLLELKGGSAKTDWVNQYYKDYPDKPTIFFSTFTSYLNLLASECPYSHALITS